MGTVYARGRKLWVGFIGPLGKWVYRSSGYVKGQELLAQKLVAELEERIARGQLAHGSELTVEEYGTKWAQRRVEKGKHTNAKLDAKAFVNHVFGAALDVVGRRVVFGELLLTEVRLVHVRAFLEHLELKNIGTEEMPDHLAPRTRRSIYNLVQRMFVSAEREELITKSPCQLERGELPVVIDKDPTWRHGAVFGTQELERLISSELVPLDRRVIYAIGFCCGLREGEVSALTWADFERQREGQLGCLTVFKSYTRKNKRVKETKTKVSRSVPVHPVAGELLERWAKTGWAHFFGREPGLSDLIAPNRSGRHLTDLNIVDNLNHDLEQLGMRRRHMHDTRRTFVTLAQVGGARWEFLRFISHGPTKKEMQSVYTVPPWPVLCEQVKCLKVALPASTADRATTVFTTTGETAMKEVDKTAEKSCPGRDSNSPSNPPRPDGSRVIPTFYLSSVGDDGPVWGTHCSSATTVFPGQRPFRGGMRIDDEELDEWLSGIPLGRA